MRRMGGLDALIARFRHRWETDKQYRAAMSGVIGLAVVLGMCACMSAVSVVANGALTGGGFLPGSSGQQTGGGGVAQAAPSFPTPTVPTWSVPATPVWSPVPNSQTPVPPPTAAPTNTPQAGGLSGRGKTSKWYFCPDNCNELDISGPPNVVVTFTIVYPTTPPQTIADNKTVTTNADGNAAYTFSGPLIISPGKATVTLQAGDLTDSFKWPCTDQPPPPPP